MIFQTVVDFLHLLATVSWIGGMIYINVVLMPTLPALGPESRGTLMGAAAKRFAMVSWSSVVVLLLTGLQKTPTGMLFDLSTSYGITLTIKHILVLIMIGGGLFITFVIVPRMTALAPKPQEKPTVGFFKTQKQLQILAVTNMLLGIGVLFCVVLLKV